MDNRAHYYVIALVASLAFVAAAASVQLAISEQRHACVKVGEIGGGSWEITDSEVEGVAEPEEQSVQEVFKCADGSTKIKDKAASK